MARRTFKKKTTSKSKPADKMGKIKHKITEVDGIKFHSIMESNYYIKLKADKEAGVIKDFELQPKFILQEKFIIVDGEIVYGTDARFNKLKRASKAETIRQINYIGDFLITHLDDSEEVVDTKGKSTADFEIKKKMFLCKYPHYKFSILIYNKIEDSWVDYYQYNKELRAKKKAKKAAES